MRGFDSNLAGEYVRLTAPGHQIEGQVRAAWIEEHGPPAHPSERVTIMLLIELGADSVQPPRMIRGETRTYRYRPSSDRLVILHDAEDLRRLQNG